MNLIQSDGEPEDEKSLLHSSDDTIDIEWIDDDKEVLEREEEEEKQGEENDKKKTSNLLTAFNIMNLIQGMGVLGIPYAISIGGFAIIPDILLVGWITNHTSKVIIDCLYENVDEEDIEERWKKNSNYAAIGEDVWKTYGSRIISFTQLIHLFGASILYLLLIARFLEDCFLDQFGTAFMCRIASGILLLPTVFISNMKQLGWLSLISVSLIDVTFIVLIVYSFTQFHNWKTNELPVFDFQGFAIAHCIVLFSYVAHPYLPRIEDGMQNPKTYSTVSNISFALATMVKLLFGIAVAFCYGASTEQEVSLNLQDVSLRKAMGGCLALVGYYSSPMPGAVMTNIIQRSQIEYCKHIFPMIQLKNAMTWSEKYIDIGMRTFLIVLTVLTACLIPEFSLLMAIFGSCTAVLLTIIFPIWFHYVLNKGTNKISLMIFLLFGIASGIIGFITSVMKLVENMK